MKNGKTGIKEKTIYEDASSKNHVIQFKVLTDSGIMWIDIKNSRGTIINMFPVSISILKDALRKL